MYKDAHPDIVMHLPEATSLVMTPGKFFYDSLTMGIQTMHNAQTVWCGEISNIQNE
jgi:hypothetical protein